ncbi:MAG: hypothetical protein WA431_05575 [Candidatus Cybelea sp.]
MQLRRDLALEPAAIVFGTIVLARPAMVTQVLLGVSFAARRELDRSA